MRSFVRCAFFPAALLVAITAGMTSATATGPLPETFSAAVHKDTPTQVAIAAARVKLDETAAAFTVRTSADVSSAVKTPKLEGLKVAASYRTAQAFKKLLPNETVDFVPASMNDFVSYLNAEVDSRIAAAEIDVVAWETELVAEKERIRVAEEKRQAEEAARAAANRAASTSHSSAVVQGASQSARVARIAASLPFSVPWRIGSCSSLGPQTLGCYDLNSGSITLTDRVLGRSDCQIRGVLAHEYRHAVQHASGLIQLDGAGNILNRDALEADAYGFGGGYGC